MAPTTPYSPHLEGRDPLAVMRETIPALAQAVAGWTPEQFERPVAPGKWTIKQILTHLAQTEMALGTRARMALTRSAFTAQSFDQDGWLAREHTMSGVDAVQAFVVHQKLVAFLARGAGKRIDAGSQALRQLIGKEPEAL